MLRDATPELLAVLWTPALGMDYLAVPWTPALPGQAGPVLDIIPAESLVLGAGEDRDAVGWGRSVGIQLFQGPAADRASLGERAHGSLMPRRCTQSRSTG